MAVKQVSVLVLASAMTSSWGMECASGVLKLAEIQHGLGVMLRSQLWSMCSAQSSNLSLEAGLCSTPPITQCPEA